MIERRVEIETPEGSMTTFEYHPEEGGPYPIVLYLMDAPSIRPALRDMASRLATAGYYVLLPFLFYRVTPYHELDPDEDRRSLMQSVTRHGIIPDGQALLDFAAKNDKADSDGKIGAVGFCMSGPLVMSLAQTWPDKVAAIASVHGAWVVTHEDDSPHRQIDQIKAEVYFGWADEDPTATVDEMKIMDQAMSDAGINYRIDFMKGAMHGFAPPGGDRYNREAAEKHWEHVHAMFRRNLG